MIIARIGNSVPYRLLQPLGHIHVVRLSRKAELMPRQLTPQVAANVPYASVRIPHHGLPRPLISFHRVGPTSVEHVETTFKAEALGAALRELLNRATAVVFVPVQQMAAAVITGGSDHRGSNISRVTMPSGTVCIDGEATETHFGAVGGNVVIGEVPVDDSAEARVCASDVTGAFLAYCVHQTKCIGIHLVGSIWSVFFRFLLA